MPPVRLGHARLVTLAVECVAWWALTLGVWLASLSAWSWHDFVVAAGCAVPCAAAAVVARRLMGGSWPLPRQLWRWVALLPAAVVVDAARVLVLPLRRSPSAEFRTIRLPAASTAKQAAGAEAFATLLLSSTPGSYVVSTDRDERSALLHVIGPPTRLERAVSR
jgi:multisubunit Na+/H+ antiporter MnhE subunit